MVKQGPKIQFNCYNIKTDTSVFISYTNPKLKADKRLIFTLVRIPQGMQRYTEEKCLYCSHLLGFPTLHAAGTGGINKVLDRVFNLLIKFPKVIQFRISCW